jgi:methionine-rich copper-binding protein CopC
MRAVLLATAVALLAQPALAHAHLEHATPRVGGTVTAAPHEVRLRFSIAVEPGQSRVVVTDAAGRAVPTGALACAQGAPAVLVAPLRATLAPGVYRVTWSVVSIDDHPSRGQFAFTVAR